ncbi:hypothetical protein BpHYR1_053531 [Brachionus plicatilis]|uniref:Uncharacterized protein n=1 Tax=Brachionus plicatilis TaxID=10195 RepID=A0A3M7P5X8_BRAPC|nr:hypothetical protein BpHYR1_053531 [Brachionus plicatilis]
MIIFQVQEADILDLTWKLTFLGFKKAYKNCEAFIKYDTKIELLKINMQKSPMSPLRVNYKIFKLTSNLNKKFLNLISSEKEFKINSKNKRDKIFLESLNVVSLSSKIFRASILLLNLNQLKCDLTQHLYLVLHFDFLVNFTVFLNIFCMNLDEGDRIDGPKGTNPFNFFFVVRIPKRRSNTFIIFFGSKAGNHQIPHRAFLNSIQQQSALRCDLYLCQLTIKLKAT